MAIITWAGGASYGQWNDPANWSGGVVPTAADTVYFSSVAYATISGTGNECLNIETFGIVRLRMAGGDELNIYGTIIANALYDIESDASTGPGTFIFHGASAQFSRIRSSPGLSVNIEVVSGANLSFSNDSTLDKTIVFDSQSRIACLAGSTLTFGDFTISCGFLDLYGGATIIANAGSQDAIFYLTAQDRWKPDVTQPDLYIDYGLTVDASVNDFKIYITPPNAGVTKTAESSRSVAFPNAEVTASGLTIYVTGAAASSNGTINFTGMHNIVRLEQSTALTYTIEGVQNGVYVSSASTPASGSTLTLGTASFESGLTKYIYNYNKLPGLIFRSNVGSTNTTWNYYGTSRNIEGDVDFTSTSSTTLVLHVDIQCESFEASSSAVRVIEFKSGADIRCFNFDANLAPDLTFIGTPSIVLRTPGLGVTTFFKGGAAKSWVVSTVTVSTGGTIDFSGDVEDLTIGNVAITASGSIYVADDFTVSGTNPTLSLDVYMIGASGASQTINLNNNTMQGATIIDASGATVTLSNFNTTSYLDLIAGTLTFNNITTSLSKLSGNYSNTRALNLGNSSITITGSGTAFDFGTSTGLTVTSGTATINMTSASAKTFAGGGKSWPTVNQGGLGTLTVTGNNTFANFTNSVTGCAIAFPSGTTTFSNFSVRGAAGSLVTISSTSTLSKATGVVSVNYLNLSNSTATGGADWYAGSFSVDGGGNSGWQFISPSSGGGFLAFF